MSRLLLGVVLLAAAACGGSPSTTAGGGSPATADVVTSDPAASSTPQPRSTRAFSPRVSYTVPQGWINAEDNADNFVLIPPTGTLAGVRDDISDFIGVFRGVAAAAENCDEVPQPGIGTTAAALADWLRSHAGLEVTPPRAVTIGGVDGLSVDVRVASGYKGTCPYAHDGEPLVPLIVGINDKGLHHVITATFTMRLYVLDSVGANTVIEVVDHPAGDDLEAYSKIVDSIRFE